MKKLNENVMLETKLSILEVLIDSGNLVKEFIYCNENYTSNLNSIEVNYINNFLESIGDLDFTMSNIYFEKIVIIFDYHLRVLNYSLDTKMRDKNIGLLVKLRAKSKQFHTHFISYWREKRQR